MPTTSTIGSEQLGGGVEAGEICWKAGEALIAGATCALLAGGVGVLPDVDTGIAELIDGIGLLLHMECVDTA